MARLEINEPAGRYADGAENELLELIRTASDRSVRSSELRGLIHDWPTHYHLSHRRGELLRPLTFGPGARVLEIGAGAGAVTRWLGEQGHDVVAVEGALARAEIAAERCADLDNVRVLCGSASDVADEDPFDAVLLIGVVEYAGVGGFPSADDLLATCAQLVAPGGVLVVAIENQLGLQYVAGAPEDHRLQPWSGIEGYRRPGPRTWSRRTLRTMIGATGLTSQRWLYPFPDYKLPVSVLAEQAFDDLPLVGGGPGLVTGLGRGMQSNHHHGWRHPFDLKLAHEVVVEAGLGPDLANSFLVVAGRADAHVEPIVDPRVQAWLLGDERLPRWQAPRVIESDGDQLVVRSLVGPVDRRDAWLGQVIDEREPFLSGIDLARQAGDACLVHDGPALDAVLAAWVRALDECLVPADVTTADHPFAGEPGQPLLSADCLDIDLGNFVEQPDGTVHRIDREWRASGPVNRELVMVRALWNFARGLVGRCITFPGAPDLAVDDVALELARRAGLSTVPHTLHRWRQAERALQEAAIGSRQDQSAVWLDGGLTVLRIGDEGLMPRTRAAELNLP